MVGILEKILTTKYGPPSISQSGNVKDYRWQEHGDTSILHKGLLWDDSLRQKYAPLEELYGDAMGGSLLGGILKVTLLRGPESFGLYLMDEFQEQPEVIRAITHDSTISFCMDAANVWFYGVKDEQLFSYDAETDELECKGPLEQAMFALLGEWDKAKP